MKLRSFFPDAVRYAVLFSKANTRKKKTWEFDGIFELTPSRYGRLRSLDGNISVEGSIDDSINDDTEIFHYKSYEVMIDHKMDADERPQSPVRIDNEEVEESPSVSSASVSRKRPIASMRLPIAPAKRPLLTKPSLIPQGPRFQLMEPCAAFPKGVFVSSVLSAALRPHQQEGVKWLFDKLHSANSGAILADEMGLGKSLQAISLMHTMKETMSQGRRLITKVLLICPLVVRANWEAEFKKWLKKDGFCFIPKDLKEVERYSAISLMCPVCIINYDMVKPLCKQLKNIRFDLLVCDEGHVLKNKDGKTRELIDSLNIGRRLLLTGTPIQNSIRELYDLVNFILPEKYAPFANFQEQIEQQGSLLFSEFLLRRTGEVNKQILPPRQDFVIFCKLAPLQKQLYEAVLECMSCSSIVCIQGLCHICNGPTSLLNAVQAGKFADLTGVIRVFPEDYNPKQPNTEHSVKALLISSMAVSFRMQGDKSVVVSRFTQTLDLLEHFLQYLEFSVLRIDGSVSGGDRQKIVDRFNNEDDPRLIMLLSTSAGGVGLNLIGANRLIMYDCGWNPALDVQAMGRIWRYGQTKPCYIYRLMTAGTIEEKIFQRQMSKVGISSVIEGDENELKGISDEELRDLMTYDDSATCRTHDLIECTCNGDGEFPEASSVPDDGNDENCFDEEPSEQCTNERVSKGKRATMAELFRWQHHSSSGAKFKEAVGKCGIDSDVSSLITFVMELSSR